jgi:hypothetical protein
MRERGEHMQPDEDQQYPLGRLVQTVNCLTRGRVVGSEHRKRKQIEEGHSPAASLFVARDALNFGIIELLMTIRLMFGAADVVVAWKVRRQP